MGLPSPARRVQNLKALSSGPPPWRLCRLVLASVSPPWKAFLATIFFTFFDLWRLLLRRRQRKE